MSMQMNSLVPQARGTCAQAFAEHAYLGSSKASLVQATPLIQSRLRLRSRKPRGAKIRPGTVSPRATVEPRQYSQGERKCAPLFEDVGESVPSGSSEWRAVPDIWKTAAEKYGDRVALVDPHRKPPAQITYKQLEQSILDFAEGLRVCGIRPDQHMSLFADNSHRWLIADQGIMAAGAAAAVRGSRSSADELYHILTHSDSVALVVDNLELYNKIASRLKGNIVLKFVIVLWGSKDKVSSIASESDVPVHSFEDLMTSGRTSRQALAAVASSGERVQYDVIRPDDVATLVYTSGTTGNPKGVMLTHGNLLHQIVHLGAVVQPQPGDRLLSLLPPWHMYERSAEYFALSRGVSQVYTSVKCLKEDLVRYPPDYFIAVPLVFDILYSGVQKQLAAASKIRKQVALTLLSLSIKFVDFKRVQEGRDVTRAKESFTPLEAAKEWAIATIGALILLPFHLLAKKLVYSKILASIGIKKAAISGGGSLPPHVDKFFEAVGITVLNGYGLTETAPVLSCRLPSNNVLGSVGGPLPQTEVKVVDPDTGNVVPPGIKGMVKGRGPQVMKGYYKNPTTTSKAIDSEGWFETGDLGWEVPYSKVGPARMCGGLLVLDGRAKDTIVLSSGENVEPQEIEETIMKSKLIQNVVVVGQDQRRLGALIVASDELQVAVKDLKQANGDSSEPTKSDMTNVIREEIKQLLAKSSFPVGPIVLIDEPFTIENGLLTPTMKVRREEVSTRFKNEIDTLYQVK